AEIVIRTLVKRDVQRRRSRGVQRSLFYILNDADDFDGYGRIRVVGNLFPQRVFAGEMLPRERLVDDRYAGFRHVLGFVEVSAAQQRRAYRRKVIWGHVPFGDVDVFPMPWAAQHADPGRIAVGGHRDVAGEPD